MGFVDSDTHVRENDRVWTYLDPDERDLAPATVDGKWRIGDLTFGSPFLADRAPDSYHALFPPGSVDLEDPDARVRRMDELGADVHVLFSSWWIGADVPDPRVEAALARSWNRWMAERTASTRGRLRWALQVPFRAPERAREELAFGREHGAVAIHLRGYRHGYGVADPIYFPVYEQAQDLGLVAAVHVGGDGRVLERQSQLVFLNNLAPVAGAFHSVVKAGLPDRFPRLRWAFVEAGASWLPFALQEALRSDQSAAVRNFKDWRTTARDVLADLGLFVACQIDDDLPYLCEHFASPSHLVHGTDYGHLDVGSDPYGLQIVADRNDISAETARGIVDDNARRLWGIDPSFTPAPALTSSYVPELHAMPEWLGNHTPEYLERR